MRGQDHHLSKLTGAGVVEAICVGVESGYYVRIVDQVEIQAIGNILIAAIYFGSISVEFCEYFTSRS